MKKTTSNFTVFLLLSVLTSLIIYFRWLNFSIFQYGDWRFHFAEVAVPFMEPSPWSTNFSFGQVSIFLWKLPYNFFYGLFGKLGFDSNYSEKFLILWPIVIVPPIAAFCLVRHVLRSNMAAFVGSLVYAFNTYFFSIDFVGHEFLTLAAAIGLFSFLSFIRALRFNRISDYIWTALIGTLSLIYDPRMAYLVILMAMIYLFYYFASSTMPWQKILKTRLGPLSLLAVLMLTLNLYWLLPSIFTGSALKNEIMARSLFGDHFLNMSRAVALFHPFWTGSKPEWFVVQPIPMYFFIIPTLAVLGLLLNRKNKVVMFFGLVALLGILLAKQSGEPFSRLYYFLFMNVPGFAAFREASKFYFFIAIAYAILVASLANWAAKSNWARRIPSLKFLLVILIVGIAFYNGKPMISGTAETMFTPRTLPSVYVELKNLVLSDNEYSRVLWIPSDVPWEVNSLVHPTISLARTMGAEWGSTKVDQNYDPYAKPEDRMRSLVLQSNFQQILENSSIKYLVVPIRDSINDNDFFQFYGRSRATFIKTLEKLSFLRKLKFYSPEVVIFENELFRPHVYITQTPDSIFSQAPMKRVAFSSSGPSVLKLDLKNMVSDAYVNFTDNYHPDWAIYLNSPSKFWLTDIDKANSLRPETSDAGFNLFKISPALIKERFPKETYVENPDGSIDVSLTIYFNPQSYLNLGILISLTTLILCLAYLLFTLFFRRRIFS